MKRTMLTIAATARPPLARALKEQPRYPYLLFPFAGRSHYNIVKDAISTLRGRFGEEEAQAFLAMLRNRKTREELKKLCAEWFTIAD